MSKKLTIAFMFLLALTASAQTSIYHPFPDSNATWCDYAASNNSGALSETYSTYELNGQATINGIVYNRLLHYQITDFLDTNTLYIRQDAALKKVWIYIPGTNSDTILYDFNLQVGDTLNQREYWAMNFQSPDYWIVSSIDSILINGSYRKQFHYSNTLNPTCFASMIEGIGADHGLRFPPSSCFEYYAALRAFHQDGTILYGDSLYPCHDFNSGVTEQNINKSSSVFPNPFHTSAQLEFNSGNDKTELIIYNSLGAPVASKNIISRTTSINRDGLPDGIYFYKIINQKGNLSSGKFVIE